MESRGAITVSYNVRPMEISPVEIDYSTNFERKQG